MLLSPEKAAEVIGVPLGMLERFIHDGIMPIRFDRVGGDMVARIEREEAEHFRDELASIAEYRAKHSPCIIRFPPFQRIVSGVYFVKAGDRIKIGVARNIQQRLTSLQTSHPEEIKVVAMRSGGRAEEAEAHREFAKQHIRGEWYRLEGALADYLVNFSDWYWGMGKYA